MEEELISHMKIPDIFVPEKNLENKIKDFKKGHKTLHHEEPVEELDEQSLKNVDDRVVLQSAYDLITIAEEVAKKLGFSGGPGYYRFPGYHNKFNGKRTKLKIICKFPHKPYFNETLKVYSKKGLFRKEKVLEFSKDHKEVKTLDYIPGKWEKDLKELYTLALLQ